MNKKPNIIEKLQLRKYLKDLIKSDSMTGQMSVWLRNKCDDCADKIEEISSNNDKTLDFIRFEITKVVVDKGGQFELSSLLSNESDIDKVLESFEAVKRLNLNFTIYKNSKNRYKTLEYVLSFLGIDKKVHQLKIEVGAAYRCDVEHLKIYEKDIEECLLRLINDTIYEMCIHSISLNKNLFVNSFDDFKNTRVTESDVTKTQYSN